MRNKKWLNLCLLAGIILFTAVFACHPMLEKGAENKILQQLFTTYAGEQNRYPAVLSYVSGSEAGFHTLQEVYDRMDELKSDWNKNTDSESVGSMQYVSLPSKNANSSMGGRNWMLSVGNLRDMDEHIKIVKRIELEMDTGAFPCLISESTMDTYGISVGEEITYSGITNAEGKEARFVVKGIFAMASETDPYWYRTPEEFDHELFVEQDTFDTLLSEYGYTMLTYESHQLLDHTRITWRNASAYLQYISRSTQEDTSFSSNLNSLLQTYEKESRNASVILWVLELPCLVLLLLFIYMVSVQILNTEESEMAVFRSRGVSRGQLLRLYLLQSVMQVLLGIIFGLPAGFLLCRTAAGTDAFLTFSGKDTSLYQINEWMALYAAAAGFLVIIFMIIPVWKRSRITIVQQKKMAAVKDKKPVWEKIFLDLILLGLSIYLLYNYQKQSASWDAAIQSERMDPMIFLNASLFTFSFALILIRVSKYLVRLIWKIGKKRWRPALYSSFLEMLRTFSKRSFLAVFLIMTVANGIFDANMARTMNKNGEERIRYNAGCDVRLQERWQRRYYYSNSSEKGEDGVEKKMEAYYEEPDFENYENLIREGLCDRATRVLMDDKVIVNAPGKPGEQCSMMAIHTKEFGETAELLDGINETHWYNALNELAAKADGIIISRNMAEKLELSVGDNITYNRYRPFGKHTEEDLKSAQGQVCAVIDGFPGYEQYGNGEEQYLIIANYAEVAGQFEQTPYEVWLNLAEGVHPEQISAVLEDKEIKLEKWKSMQQDLEQRESSPLIQITNGLFTMNFLISLLICSAGFLIYWIMSIRSREQLFGIYRAMGMRLRELVLMLLNEQLFGSVLSILSGVAAGLIVTTLFTRLTALIYLPEKHTIAIRIFSYGSDMLKLFAVLGIVILICFVILWQIVRRMKIAQALRMGEEE